MNPACAVDGHYQAVRPKVGYGSLVKFLSRGKWDSDAGSYRGSVCRNRFVVGILRPDLRMKRICSQIPPGLIIFDRGFNRRKVFEAVLSAGHHLLCRAKSNAVFYLLPTVCKRPKPGRPKTYGKRIHLRHLRYKAIDIDNKRCSVASKVVRTKMCPTQIVPLAVAVFMIKSN